jgi:glyoxylase-like metal-dependent hydrolase (beta-lactamase superfamily II)
MEEIMAQPLIEAFFDEPTNTISYLVADPATRSAAVIDPVLDFDMASGVADTRSAERILAFARKHDWRIAMVLETHAHADHLSAAPFIKAHTGAWIGIGAHIRQVQAIFRPVFAMDDLKADGSISIACSRTANALRSANWRSKSCMCRATPRRCRLSHRRRSFVGDTLFMPDYGTARDFPGGDAYALSLDPPPARPARGNPAVPVP